MSGKQPNFKKVIDHLLTRIPIFAPEQTVKQALEEIRSHNNWETLNYVYVTDANKNLLGVISIKELLHAKDTSLLKNIMKSHPVGVSASANQERAAVAAIEHNIKAVPVLRAGTRELLGVVGPDQILNILHREHVEDMLRFSGITKEHPTVDIYKVSFSKLFKMRMPWLLIGLVGGMIATALVSYFEVTLRKEIALSFFIPVLVYISNAIAIQSQTLLIRLLASQKTKNISFIKKELFVSLLLALASSIILCSYAFFWLGSLKLALTVGLAVLVSTVAAVLIATSIPLVLFSLKKDPALGSGPMATAIQDISTLLIYFIIATAVFFN